MLATELPVQRKLLINLDTSEGNPPAGKKRNSRQK
jgi:hypothetical protein